MYLQLGAKIIFENSKSIEAIRCFELFLFNSNEICSAECRVNWISLSPRVALRVTKLLVCHPDGPRVLIQSADQRIVGPVSDLAAPINVLNGVQYLQVKSGWSNAVWKKNSPISDGI